MKQKLKNAHQLAPELRRLVRQTLTLLGNSYEQHYGPQNHKMIMKLREEMSRLRGAKEAKKIGSLKSHFKALQKLSPKRQYDLARGLALMMEITNLCENAYRSFRLQEVVPLEPHRPLPESQIIWVLTSHPTESRTRSTVLLLQVLQNVLAQTLKEGWSQHVTNVQSLISLIVQAELAPQKKPQPEDEAKYQFETVLKFELWDKILEAPEIARSFRLRTWVGGDKDGHPGVDDKTLIYSLECSRGHLVDVLMEWLRQWAKRVEMSGILPISEVRRLQNQADSLRKIKKLDSQKILQFQKALKFHFSTVSDPASHELFSQKIQRLFQVFPMLVVPIELRESSDVLAEAAKTKSIGLRKKFSIYRMLLQLAHISEGDKASAYVQAFVISMVHESQDLKHAETLMRSVFKKIPIPIVPLFETHEALMSSANILEEFLQKNHSYTKLIKKQWYGRMEVMLGYSDSSKQSGVLSSRVSIRYAMGKIERALRRLGLKPLYFHGTGGSVARGGGRFQDQSQGWSLDVIRNYKATMQGEVVSRTFSSSAILKSQIQKIQQEQRAAHYDPCPISSAVVEWAELTRQIYESKVGNPQFLWLLQNGTLYPYLSELKIGSRPSKRKTLGSVKDLRAIPWVLCWTQTRVLMPTWWGVGSAWESLTLSQREKIRRLYKQGDGFVVTYINQLRFTLAKVELSVWRMYLEQLAKDKGEYKHWELEYNKTLKAVRWLTQEKNLMSFRPWLGESIYLRSSYIAPLNLLQIIAIQRRDFHLLRLTVTGIASGMLTTG